MHVKREIVINSVEEIQIPGEPRQSFELRSNSLEIPTTSNVVTSMQNNQILKTLEQLFAEYVAQRLTMLPDDLSRRRLENALQEAFVKAKKEALR